MKNILGITICLLLLSVQILATNASLSRKEINIDYNNSTKLILTNKADEIKAFEISLYERNIDEKGQDIKVDSDIENNFLIIPSQVILSPFGEETISITYIGDKNITKEKAYHILIKQIEINFDENNTELIQRSKDSLYAKLTVLTNLIKNMYLTQSNFEPKLEIINKKINDRTMEIEIKNSGQKRLIMGGDKPKLFFLLKDTDNNILKFRAKTAILLPNQTFKNIIEIPKSVNLKDQDISWEFSR
ncbi:MAG: hypothetical protein VW378_03680 [bacterium]